MWIYYTNEKHSRLKHKFKGSEDITINHSQSGQDIFTLMMLDGKRNGTYLEIGAHDPINISNTYLLEKSFDWRGLSIDIQKNPNFEFVRKNDYLIADALNTDYNEILERFSLPSNIDYLSIDIEPSINTFTALKKIPHDKYKFNVITFEHDFYSGDPYNVRIESREFLQSLGYKLVARNLSGLGTNYPFEDWYVNPNVIDPEIIDKVINTSDDTKFFEDVILSI